MAKNVDILVVSETKIDGTFPPGQFLIEGFKHPLRYDRNQNGGGILVYVREGVPSEELKFEFSATMECLITEINLHKKKWAMLSIYRPPSQDEKFYEELGKAMDYLSDTYENFIILGDFNNEENDDEIRNFLDAYGLNNLVKGATCFKSDTNPRTIDLILTNRKRCFSNTLTTETGLSDFHLMVSTVLKSGFVKRGPKIINYRDYSKFDHVKFRSDLRDELSKCYRDGTTYDHFKTVKPLFSDKIQTPGSITLLEGDELVSDDKKVAEILNGYFVNITASVEISGVEENLVKTNEVSDPIDIDVNMYKRHPSIQLIKQRVTVNEKFSFQRVSLEEISSQFKNLDPTKASPFGSIPVKMLTEHSDLFAPLVQLFINESIDTSNFPKELRKGDITSLFKNGDAFAKKNYRPIIVLPAISKFTKEHFQVKLLVTWKISCLLTFVRIVKAITPSMDSLD